MLEGDLSDFTLPEILKLLAFTNKTGRLHLRSGDTLGRVEVGAGRIQAASADAAHLPLARRLVGRGLLDTDTLQELIGGRRTLPTDLELAQSLIEADPGTATAVGEAVQAQSVDAVFDLLRWEAGRFRFAGEKVEADGPLADAHDLDELLEKAQERLERWAEIHERTGPGHASVSVTSPPDTHVEIDADAWQLIGLADGTRTIDELARLTGRGQFDTRSTLVELADRGLVAFGTEERDGALERLLRTQSALGEIEARLGGTPAEAEELLAHAARDAAGDATADTAVDGIAAIDDAAVDADTLVADLDLDVASAADGDTADEADDDAPVAEDAATADVAADDDAPVDTDDRPAPDPVPVKEPVTTGMAGRRPRLRTDPTVDPALVDRLIDGVRNLA
jgi:hypothetical protein